MATEVYGRIGDTDWQTIVECNVNWLCIRNEGECGHAHDEQHSVLNQFHISPYLKNWKATGHYENNYISARTDDT